MSEIAPVYLAEDDDNIAIGVPFSKISIKDRTVEGFATLDNVDSQFDVVDFEASKIAFANWIGNIREMHGPVAVGKAISIEERTLDRGGRSYRGIWVKARISKGAESTWQKILDGTLNGFSIGGKVLERKPEIVKSDDGGRYSESRVNRITKYILGELSVVDNPANPLALFEGVEKMYTLIKMDSDEHMVAGDAIIEPQGLFYCQSCDVAKTDAVDFSEIECITCDNKMDKIGQVVETPSVTDLKKMVDSHLEKAVSYPDAVESDGEAGFGQSGEWKPNPELIEVEVETVTPEGTPQSGSPAPHAEKAVEPALDAQTAEGEDSNKIKIRVESLDPKLISEKVFEALKSRVEFPGRSRVDKQEIEEDQEFVRSLLDKSFGFNVETVGQIRASIVLFNTPGQRSERGYSMSEWAILGKRIVAAAGDGHSFTKGRIEGPLVTEEDFQRGEFIINLQKNETDANNDMIKLLQNLVGYLHDDSAINKGGETPTLDVKELEKILDILETATKEVGEVLKGFSVERLNSEDASGPTLGSDPGEAGVGTAQENDGGEARAFAEVEVAEATSMPAPDNGPDKVVPDAISVDGTGVHEGVTADSGSEKVLPHADLTSESVTTKSEEAEEAKVDEPEDLMKSVLGKIEGAFEAFNDRLAAIEESGGVKKSVEVANNELKKSDSTPFWSGVFSADELRNE